MPRLDLRSAARAMGIAVPIVLGLLAGRALAPWLPGFTEWVHALGAWAPVAFVIAYVLVVVLMLPAFLLIMVGGAVFGTATGTALSMTGALAGGISAFLIGRHYARGPVARRVARNPTLAAVDRVIGEDGMRLVFLLRLSPAIPFVLSNYALGVSRVRLRDFVLGTFGLIPIVLTYAAYGSASGAVRTEGTSPISMPVLAVGIVATIVLGVLLARIAQRAIREAEASRTVEPNVSIVTRDP